MIMTHHVHHRRILPGVATGAFALAASAAAVVATTAPVRTRRQDRRNLDGLGKWNDGPPTEVDCSLSAYDFEYYVERCWDDRTQWWINGRCVDGVKEEVSELHRCMRPDGSRPYCHDCNDGQGNVKNVCGSDGPPTGDDDDVSCDLAMSTGEGRADDCGGTIGDGGLVVYSHQCVDRPGSGGGNSWSVREDFWCDEQEVYVTGPNMEQALPDGGGGEVLSQYTCGEEWYYEYEPDDPNVKLANPELVGLAHPFVSPANRYCLDCGLAVQVCVGVVDATCEDLGLPAKGEDDPRIRGIIEDFVLPPTASPTTWAPTTPMPTTADDEGQPRVDWTIEGGEGAPSSEGGTDEAAAQPPPSAAATVVRGPLVSSAFIAGLGAAVFA